MIAILDYERGNLRSVQKGFETVGHHAVVTRDPSLIAQASHVVLPGVGAFGDCVNNLRRFGLIDPIHRTIEQGKPFLGICVGMQVLFSESEEFGVHPGLNVFRGKVKRFPSELVPASSLKVPHIGWNTIRIKRNAPFFAGLDSDPYVYFVHSYYVEPDESDVVCTETPYGRPFVSSVIRENIVACQFHPEKSQRVGLQLLKNFGSWN